MATNYLEQFSIGFGFDLKNLKADSKKLEKILSNLDGKKINSLTKEEKLEKRIRTLKRKSEAENMQALIKRDKAIANAHTKERKAHHNTMKQEGLKRQAKIQTAKVEQESAQKALMERLRVYKANKASARKIEEAEQKAIAKAEKVRDDASRKREIARARNRAKLRRDRLAEEAKANAAAKRSLNERLRRYKAEKAKARRIEEGEQRSIDLSQKASKYGTSIRGSENFNNLKRSDKKIYGERLATLVKSGDIQGLKTLEKELTRLGIAHRRYQAEMKRTNVVQKGLTDSTRNMIRSYASMFAIFEGVTAIKRVGQEFQGMEAAMLASSGSAKAAKEDFGFINEIVDEMGLNLKDTTDAFVKFKFAAKGKMADSEMKELFRGISMFGTALKVAPEDMKRAQRAISQMASKGVVMAEELKMQLGDALPGAVQVFARAMNMTEAELFKAMESGSVLASEALPKVAEEYRKAAIAGGAYDLALKGLRVTEGKLATETARAGKTLFNSGFEEGLSKLFNTLQKILKDAPPQLTKLGKAFEVLFKGVAYGIELVSPMLDLLVDTFYEVGKLGKEFKTTAMLIAAGLGIAFAPITTALLAATELVSLFTDKMVGTIELSLGKQINLTKGTTMALTKNKKGEYTRSLSGGEQKWYVPEAGAGNIFQKAERWMGSTPQVRPQPVQSKTTTVVNHNTFQVTDYAMYRDIENMLTNGISPPQGK